MRWRIRCSKESCKIRYSLPRHPDDYVRGWKCRGCGGSKFRVIKNRTKERGATLCNCSGYAWVGAWTNGTAPHRRGSPWCWYRADGTQRMPGDPDFQDPNYPQDNA